MTSLAQILQNRDFIWFFGFYYPCDVFVNSTPPSLWSTITLQTELVVGEAQVFQGSMMKMILEFVFLRPDPLTFTWCYNSLEVMIHEHIFP